MVAPVDRPQRIDSAKDSQHSKTIKEQQQVSQREIGSIFIIAS